MHRRKVKGSILGNSKTGSIVYIQPEATQQHTRELNNLQYEEKEEIKRILKALTDLVRPYDSLLSEYQTLLSHIDLISAIPPLYNPFHHVFFGHLCGNILLKSFPLCLTPRRARIKHLRRRL